MSILATSIISKTGHRTTFISIGYAMQCVAYIFGASAFGVLNEVFYALSKIQVLFSLASV